MIQDEIMKLQTYKMFEGDSDIYVERDDVLEVLKQEPCEDCISRQAAKKIIFEEFEGWPTDEEVVQLKRLTRQFDELPSVTPARPKSEWIPVSEKLPNDRDWYLGIFKESDTGWINPLPFVCDYVGHETKATTKDHWILRGFTDRDEHIDYYFNLECIAWMQLPKPYKAESEDKE